MARSCNAYVGGLLLCQGILGLMLIRAVDLCRGSYAGFKNSSRVGIEGERLRSRLQDSRKSRCVTLGRRLFRCAVSSTMCYHESDQSDCKGVSDKKVVLAQLAVVEVGAERGGTIRCLGSACTLPYLGGCDVFSTTRRYLTAIGLSMQSHSYAEASAKRFTCENTLFWFFSEL